MGCGRVGSALAIELEGLGHSVSVIDQNREAFRRLGPDFKGRTIAGGGLIATLFLKQESKLLKHLPPFPMAITQIFLLHASLAKVMA